MNKCNVCKYYITPKCEKCIKKEHWEVSLLLLFSAIFFAFGIAGIIIFVTQILG